ncbi:heavy metal translocating P-type ATPase [Polaribacter sp. Asnod1-A03]|uniref:heavy metal translocating P-type ATPase n=1 Tax=Polaribacter sp. Asnod1-A03 TaxID=3160581 RepID=UPI00386D4822
MKEQYKITGMTCASCAMSIESHLKPQNGITEVAVNYPNKSVAITYNKDLISLKEIAKKVKEIGFTLLIGSPEKTKTEFENVEKKRLKTLTYKLIFAAVFAIPVFILSMFLKDLIPYQNYVLLILSLPVLFYSGAEFYSIAWKRLQQLSTNMDTLVALSTGIAFLFSVFNTVNPNYFLSKGLSPHVYYESAVIIITLILLGRFFEEKAKSKTSSAIKKLMGLQPKKVTAIRNGEEKIISYDDILIGELIILKPGDKIPVDGKVKKGTSFIDESMISGEPIPVEKTKGSKVFAGTINQKGSLRIIANKIGNDTLLSQIIKLVEEAQSTKPAIQKMADKIAGIFVPVVISLAVITFIIWYVLAPELILTYGLLTPITVLIIACPCALGLATPTALMVGIGKGAQQGILIKDAQALETAYKIDTLILDKTGTITQGKPKVTDVIWEDNSASTTLEQIILAIEAQSEHPIAAAIVQDLKQKNTENIITIDAFKSSTGLGAEAMYNDTFYKIGNESFMLKNNITIPDDLSKKANYLKEEAKTVVYISKAEKVVGIMAVADSIKETSIIAIDKLTQMGVQIYMLTGDNEQTAKAIAQKVGIQNFKANVLPSEKGVFVKELQEKGKVVAMAGDGINDSHALAQADVGIAMASGTDIAMDSAGITLMHSDLKQISKAIQLSKATLKTIKQNLFWAFIYNMIAIPIAAGILYPINGFLLNPMIAGAAMSLSSISVLANSLRLKNITIN